MPRKGTAGPSQLVPAGSRRGLDSKNAGLRRAGHTFDKREFIIWEHSSEHTSKDPQEMV